MSNTRYSLFIAFLSLLSLHTGFSNDSISENKKPVANTYKAQDLIDKTIPQIEDFQPSTLNLTLGSENDTLIQDQAIIKADYLQGSFLKYHRDHETAVNKSNNNLASDEQKIVGHRVTRLLEVLCSERSLINKNIAGQQLMLQCMFPVFACNKTDSKQFKLERGFFDLVLSTDIYKNNFDSKIGKKIKAENKHRVIYLDPESTQRRLDSKNLQLEFDKEYFESTRDEQEKNLAAIEDALNQLPETIEIDEDDVVFCPETFEIDREKIKLGTFEHDGQKFLIIETENLRYHDARECLMESLENLNAQDFIGVSLKDHAGNLLILKDIDYSKSKSKKGKLSTRANTVKSLIDKSLYPITQSKYNYAYAIPASFVSQELLNNNPNLLAAAAQKLWKKATAKS